MQNTPLINNQDFPSFQEAVDQDFVVVKAHTMPASVSRPASRVTPKPVKLRVPDHPIDPSQNFARVGLDRFDPAPRRRRSLGLTSTTPLILETPVRNRSQSPARQRVCKEEKGEPKTAAKTAPKPDPSSGSSDDTATKAIDSWRVREIAKVMSALTRDVAAVKKHYGKGLEDFLPHTVRYMRILKDGHRTTFMAKDTHYYWALDPKALPEKAPIEKVRAAVGGFRFTAPLMLLPHNQLFDDMPVLQAHFYAEDSMIFAQGSVFSAIPGKVHFPRHDGYVITTSNQRIIMKTTKNGAPYVSDNP